MAVLIFTHEDLTVEVYQADSYIALIIRVLTILIRYDKEYVLSFGKEFFANPCEDTLSQWLRSLTESNQWSRTSSDFNAIDDCTWEFYENFPVLTDTIETFSAQLLMEQ